MLNLFTEFPEVHLRRIGMRQRRALGTRSYPVFMVLVIYAFHIKYERSFGVYRDFLRNAAESNVRERWQIHNDILFKERHPELAASLKE